MRRFFFADSRKGGRCDDFSFSARKKKGDALILIACRQKRDRINYSGNLSHEGKEKSLRKGLFLPTDDS